jgi:hemerythrin superfamily protein
MNAIDILKRQHRGVKTLFKKALKAEAAGGRRRLMEEIAQELKLHTKLEEQIFYPAVRDLGRKGEEMVLEALEEHHVVDLVLAELPKVNPEDERFEAKMTVLSELVEHHADEEEDEMFKLAKKLGDELDELGKKMNAMIKEESGSGWRAA